MRRAPPTARRRDRAWRWQLRLRVERGFALVRAIVTAIVLIVWLTRPPVPGTSAALDWAVAVTAVLYAAGDWVLLQRLPDLASRFWPGYAIADLALVLACVASTGLQHTPFLPLLFIAAMSVPQRMPLSGGVAAAGVCAATWALLAAPDQRYVAALVAVVGMTQVMATALLRSDRVAVARDPLTGCFGRAHVLLELAQLIEHRAYPFSLILVDLDEFKAVNDRYGHAAGDLALQAAARHIAASIRGEDLLARYGGDEFLVVLGATDVQTASAAAERIRGAVEHGHVGTGAAAEMHPTLSAGVVEASGGQTAADLMQAVDHRLYRAKRDRNRVAADDAVPLAAGSRPR